MPHFFFDVDDGAKFERDLVGAELDDRIAARHAAVISMPDLARDEIPDGEAWEWRVRVREGDGTYFFEAILSFRARWI